MQVAHFLEDDMALAGSAKAAWAKLIPAAKRFKGPISKPEAPSDTDDEPPGQPASAKAKASSDNGTLSLERLVDTMPATERNIFFSNAPSSVTYHLATIGSEHRAAAVMGQLRPQGVLNLSCPLGTVPVATALAHSDGGEDSADDVAGAPRRTSQRTRSAPYGPPCVRTCTRVRHAVP